MGKKVRTANYLFTPDIFRLGNILLGFLFVLFNANVLKYSKIYVYSLVTLNLIRYENGDKKTLRKYYVQIVWT